MFLRLRLPGLSGPSVNMEICCSTTAIEQSHMIARARFSARLGRRCRLVCRADAQCLFTFRSFFFLRHCTDVCQPGVRATLFPLVLWEHKDGNLSIFSSSYQNVAFIFPLDPMLCWTFQLKNKAASWSSESAEQTRNCI